MKHLGSPSGPKPISDLVERQEKQERGKQRAAQGSALFEPFLVAPKSQTVETFGGHEALTTSETSGPLPPTGPGHVLQLKDVRGRFDLGRLLLFSWCANLIDVWRNQE